MRIILSVRTARRGGGVDVNIRRDANGKDSVRDRNAGEVVYKAICSFFAEGLKGAGIHVDAEGSE